MKRSLIIHVGYMVCICMCIVISACLFVLRDELRRERETLNRSYDMLMDHEVARADLQIATLNTLLLGQLRTWRNWKNPYERLLRGTIKIEQGEYAEAIRYLEESRTTCMKHGFDGMICSALSAETLFRQANALMSSRQRRALNMAVIYYEQGLLIKSDDVFAKKSLDWLKVFEENVEEGEDKDQSPSRGYDVFEKKQTKQGDGGGTMRKGY